MNINIYSCNPYNAVAKQVKNNEVHKKMGGTIVGQFIKYPKMIDFVGKRG